MFTVIIAFVILLLIVIVINIISNNSLILVERLKKETEIELLSYQNLRKPFNEFVTANMEYITSNKELFIPDPLQLQLNLNGLSEEISREIESLKNNNNNFFILSAKAGRIQYLLRNFKEMNLSAFNWTMNGLKTKV